MPIKSLILLLCLCNVTFLLFFITFFIKPISCIDEGEAEPLPTHKHKDTSISYYFDYCSSTVPESTPDYHPYSTDKSFGPFREFETGYYHTAGILDSDINNRYLNSFVFQTRLVHRTDRDGVFMIESSLEFQYPDYVGHMPYWSDSNGPLKVQLQGFWSEASGNLCMVGRGFSYSKVGSLMGIPIPVAVLKLNNILKKRNNITSLITGTLMGMSIYDAKKYFEPVSLLMIPTSGYKYMFVSEEFVAGFTGESDTVKGIPYDSTVLQQTDFCSIISNSGNDFSLQYTNSCSPGKNCPPFGGFEFDGYLPSAMLLKRLEPCSETKKQVRLLIEFHSADEKVGFYSHFNPNSTLIGEGFWDSKKNQLCVFVCRILDIAESWTDARVGDCTTRLTLRFPAIWSLRKTSRMAGQIWTTKALNESGYFNSMTFQSNDNRIEGIRGLKYEYTEMESVNKLCSRKNPSRNNAEISPTYDNVNAMKFDMRLESSEGKIGWGSAVPLFIGDQPYYQYLYRIGAGERASSGPLKTVLSIPVNVSYRISIKFFTGVDDEEKMEINAEGIYDAFTRTLCMVGCRKLGSQSSNQVSQDAYEDCEIVLNFQLHPYKYGGYNKGTIESTRNGFDPLYFNPLNVNAPFLRIAQEEEFFWKWNLEFLMVLISNTLACIFVGLQLYHVKKNPQVLSFISLVMLVILTLSYVIPFVLNFEALFSRSWDRVLASGAGSLVGKEETVLIITLLAFLFQCRLLQLVLSAKLESDKDDQVPTGMTLLVTVAIYQVGAVITILVNWVKYSHDFVGGLDFLMKFVFISSYTGTVEFLPWKYLRSYAGLISDSFLLPQILLNIFSNSRENTLSFPFYVGTTLIRSLQHVFDLYSKHKIVQLVDPSDEYFISIAWNVCIILGVLLFAAIIYLQQRFGGRCILPRRFTKDMEASKEVPVINES